MKLSVDLGAPVYLVRGDDDVLLEDAVVELVHALVGSGDRSLMVEELDGARYQGDGGDLSIGPVVDAAQTPPFLTERRVVLARQVGGFTTQDAVAPLIAYLRDPLDTTSLVLVWEKLPVGASSRSGKVPAKLTEAIKVCGGVVVDVSPGNQKTWLADALRDAPLTFDGAARALIGEQIGEDAGMLVGLLPTLVGVYGEGAKLTADDIAPYLGQEGKVRPFDLTDAIDAGDVPGALDALRRILDGGYHPLQVLATLTNHYLRMVTLDGAGVADEKGAAAVLGMKGSTFPARKALNQGRTLGSERLAEFVRLLAQADLDLKGAKAWPADLVVEVLVARLASRTPRASRRAAPARSGGGRR